VWVCGVLAQNKNEVIVDALPYLDKEYDYPAMRDLVDRCEALPCWRLWHARRESAVQNA
jgi:hypothetical protein